MPSTLDYNYIMSTGFELFRSEVALSLCLPLCLSLSTSHATHILIAQGVRPDKEVGPWGQGNDLAWRAALVKNMWEGPSSSSPRYMEAYGDLLYYSADDGDHGHELWRTDGTESGTCSKPSLSRSLLSGFPFSLFFTLSPHNNRVRAHTSCSTHFISLLTFR